MVCHAEQMSGRHGQAQSGPERRPIAKLLREEEVKPAKLARRVGPTRPNLASEMD